MQFSLLTALWITTVVAVALGVFGNGAVLPIGCTLLGWRYLLAVIKPPTTNRPVLDPTLLTVAMGGVLLAAVALATLPAEASDATARISPLFFLAYVAVSVLPAIWIKAG